MLSLPIARVNREDVRSRLTNSHGAEKAARAASSVASPDGVAAQAEGRARSEPFGVVSSVVF